MNTRILKNQIKSDHRDLEDDFQVVNNIIGGFSKYIYDEKGEYLIGGKEVSNFIKDFIKLYKRQ